MTTTKSSQWQTTSVPVTNVDLDQRNPRLPASSASSSPADLVREMFDHEDAAEVAESIVKRGYFPNEPILVIRDGGRMIVIEGNRRLAALKALRDPSLVSDKHKRQLEKLIRGVDKTTFSRVPVTIAPNRKSTDTQVAGRHIGVQVRPWREENRARFILEKIEEGYDTDELNEVLGFSLSDVMKARQTKAIRDMVRSLDLDPDAKEKLDNPRSKSFGVIQRIFDSKVGRDQLKVEPDVEQGFRGKTTISEFKKGLTKIALDATKKHDPITSRKLNKIEQIREYFESWKPEDLPKAKRGTFLPGDLVNDKKTSSVLPKVPSKPPIRARKVSSKVIPKTLKTVYGSERIKLILGELQSLDRVEFSNAGAVLLRVFLELCVIDFLKRIGEYDNLVREIEKKMSGHKLRFGVPEMQHLAGKLIEIAETKVKDKQELRGIKVALTKNDEAPFNVSDLHSFVHHAASLPTDRDILQFWLRAEPLFRMMLEQE